MTINSYGARLIDFSYFGEYDGIISGLDGLLIALPVVVHVFA